MKERRKALSVSTVSPCRPRVEPEGVADASHQRDVAMAHDDHVWVLSAQELSGRLVGMKGERPRPMEWEACT